jgi:Protein of Unknown function (DUF2784)
MTILYEIANVFFFVFHILLIVFNLVGWLYRPLRKWNLVTLGLTAFSWFILGYFYGFGYCFLTDWHWLVREKLGYTNPYNSYIQFLISSIFSVSLTERAVNTLTAALFSMALIVSVAANVRDWRRNEPTPD